ncbi:septum site-determining protein Ssd [Corynebacterium mayonis]|uniref:septum site-determining protein Ssd n=1 Tax=Corynebacterium mayonis TaxID=3062461 RepID=UPI003140156B
MTLNAAADPLLIAVDDPVVHPEATHVAAAAGREIINARSVDALRRHWAKAHAVFVDTAFAPAAAELPAKAGVFYLSSDVEQVHPKFESYVLPAQAGELLRALGALRAPVVETRGDGAVIAVVGAAGGVGTSTLAACLARLAAAHVEPTLVDAHRFSGGVDLLLGIEDEAGARWGEIVLGEGMVQRADVRRALPETRDGIAVLTQPRTTIKDPFTLTNSDVDRFVAAVATSGLTVVDAPVSLLPTGCDLIVVVTPAEVRGAAAAARIAAEVSPVAVVLRHRGWSSLTATEVERITKAPVIAELGEVPRLRKAVEVAGLPTRVPKTLAKVSRSILEEAGL